MRGGGEVVREHDGNTVMVELQTMRVGGEIGILDLTNTPTLVAQLQGAACRDIAAHRRFAGMAIRARVFDFFS